MSPTTNPLVMEIKNMLRRGVNDLIEDTEPFCILVNDLQDEEAELTPSERQFLEYLIPFRDKLVRDALVIASVECAEAQSQTELSAILDKSWNLKEAMRMYEGTLSASFEMEEKYDRFADRLQAEMDELEGKKQQLREDIRQDVASLLEKRRALLELKESQKMLGRAHDRSSAELEVAMDCKDALEARWKKVKEMGNLA
jgi:small-conductance mechanosensitive channel